MPPPTKYTLRTNLYPAIEPGQFKDSLKGKVALVTGSGRGIGREIAKALAQSGAAVCVTGRTSSQVNDTVNQIEASGGRALGVIADGTKREEQEKLVHRVTAELGEIDILICNAGTNTFMPFHLTEADDWWYQMEIMVKSPVELTRLVLPSMQKRNTGVVIYTSSRAAKADLPWTTAYNCAKTSITRFAGTLQAELDMIAKLKDGQNNINLFSIHPGEIETDLHQTAFPERTKLDAPYVIDFMAKLEKSRPTFDVALPAWTCVYLASGKGTSLKGCLVDCTQDVEEARVDAESKAKTPVTNACA